MKPTIKNGLLYNTSAFLISKVFMNTLLRYYFTSNIFLVSTKSPVDLSSGFASIL